MRTHETVICDEVGHEYQLAAGGRIACVCCGAERIAPPLVDDEKSEACATPGTKGGRS